MKAIIANYIDAPLHVADPAIFAIDDVLPTPFGRDPATDPHSGDTSDCARVPRQRAVCTPRTDQATHWDVVNPRRTFSPSSSPMATRYRSATRSSRSLGSLKVLASPAQRLVTDTALGLLGPVAAAQALANGDNEGLYKVVESYVDAPLHIADPTIFAIDDVLPKPFGGDPSTNSEGHARQHREQLPGRRADPGP